MKFRVATAGLSLLLGGCALPIPIQVASWALEGISVLTTKKSLTDHGVSMVAQKDCALWRGFTDSEICRDEGTAVAALSSDTAVADAGSRTDAAFVPETAITQEDAGSMDDPSSQGRITLADAPAAPPAGAVTKESLLPVVMRADAQTAARAGGPASGMAVVSGARFHYVIGSFTDRHNAAALVERYRSLEAKLMPVRLGDRMFYRVAIEPFRDETVSEARARLTKSGIQEAWLLRPSEAWTVAEQRLFAARGKATGGG